MICGNDASKTSKERDGTPLVSIAVPAYNQQDVLAEALESLVHQDYDRLEIVVSDDASRDRTAEIGQDYAARFPGRVIFVRQSRNLGPTGNVRAMAPLLRGDLICWFAGDDICLPGKISKQVAAIAAHPSAVACYHDIDVFDGATGRSLYRYNEDGPGMSPRSGLIARDLIVHRCFIGAVSIMVRREIALAVRHRPELSRVSDWLYLIEVAHRGEIIFLNEVLARYRRHPTNITNVVNIEDELKTYRLVLSLYPEYAEEVEKGLRRLKASYALRYLFAGEFRSATAMAADVARAAATRSGVTFDVASYLIRLLRQRAYLMQRTGRINR